MRQEIVKDFIDTSRKYWHILPENYRTTLESFVGELKRNFTPSEYINECVPEFWLENKEIMESFNLFLKHLSQKKGIELNPLKVKAYSQSVHAKTQLPEQIIETYYQAIQKDYHTPYLAKVKQEQEVINIGMPTVMEIEAIFSAQYPQQTVNEKFANSFFEYNQMLKLSENNIPFTGKKLYEFAKQASKLTEANIGKTFTLLLYLKAVESTTIPAHYSIVQRWRQKQNF